MARKSVNAARTTLARHDPPRTAVSTLATGRFEIADGGVQPTRSAAASRKDPEGDDDEAESAVAMLCCAVLCDATRCRSGSFLQVPGTRWAGAGCARRAPPLQYCLAATRRRRGEFVVRGRACDGRARARLDWTAGGKRRAGEYEISKDRVSAAPTAALRLGLHVA